MKHKTLSQVLAEYRERGKKAYDKALTVARDKVETEIVHDCKAIIDRKKVTLKELRYAVDIVECLAERGEENK